MRALRPFPRAAATSAVLALAVAGALVPAAATAAPSVATAVDAGTCTVTEAHIDWGFKESFRSYISSAIAHGSWETVDGATYETPVFGFTAEAGEWDPEAGTGEIPFAGGIRFTGHDGLLDTRVGDPVLVLTGPGAAVLRLDLSGVSMEDALAGNTDAVQVAEDVPFVAIDLSAATVETDGETATLVVADAPTTVTEEGFAAFPNYETGTPFDPIGIRVTAECAPVETATPSPAPTATEEPSDAVTAAPDETSGGSPDWVPWVIGGAVVLVAGVIAGVLIGRRRRGGASPAADGSGGGAVADGRHTDGPGLDGPAAGGADGGGADGGGASV